MSARVMTDEERRERRERVWQKHLRGELVTLDEFLAKRAPRLAPTLTCATCGVELGPYASEHVCPGGGA